MSKLSQVFLPLSKKVSSLLLCKALRFCSKAFVHIVSPQLLPIYRRPESLSRRRRRGDLAEQADLHVLVVAGAERGGRRGGLTNEESVCVRERERARKCRKTEKKIKREKKAFCLPL